MFLSSNCSVMELPSIQVKTTPAPRATSPATPCGRSCFSSESVSTMENTQPHFGPGFFTSQAWHFAGYSSELMWRLKNPWFAAEKFPHRTQQTSLLILRRGEDGSDGQNKRWFPIVIIIIVGFPGWLLPILIMEVMDHMGNNHPGKPTIWRWKPMVLTKKTPRRKPLARA